LGINEIFRKNKGIISHMTKNKATYSKSKAGKQLGYRTPKFFRASKFGGGTKAPLKFDPSRFKTQHKG